MLDVVTSKMLSFRGKARQLSKSFNLFPKFTNVLAYQGIANFLLMCPFQRRPVQTMMRTAFQVQFFTATSDEIFTIIVIVIVKRVKINKKRLGFDNLDIFQFLLSCLRLAYLKCFQCKFRL